MEVRPSRERGKRTYELTFHSQLTGKISATCVCSLNLQLANQVMRFCVWDSLGLQMGFTLFYLPADQQ